MLFQITKFLQIFKNNKKKSQFTLNVYRINSYIVIYFDLYLTKQKNLKSKPVKKIISCHLI